MFNLSSFGSRLGRSSEADYRMKYFEVGGMTAKEPNKICLKNMLRYAPVRVFIHLGGNDISIDKKSRGGHWRHEVSEVPRRQQNSNCSQADSESGGSLKKNPRIRAGVFRRKKNRANSILRGILKKRFILMRMKYIPPGLCSRPCLYFRWKPLEIWHTYTCT